MLKHLMNATVSELFNMADYGFSSINFGMWCAIALMVYVITNYYTKSPNKVKKASFYEKVDKTNYISPIITLVHKDFEWNKVESIKSYPFKNAEYKLTMSIRKLDPQDWLLIEPTYLKTIEVKSKLVSNTHPDYPKDRDLKSSTVFASPECAPAIKEFYNTAIKYMCDKYPMYFHIQGNQVYNSITKKTIPLTTDDETEAEKYLLYLTETIEEDVIILLKDPNSDSDEYFFKGGIFAFANGFDPANKINKPLTSIHLPIPGYEDKLKVSMNRFFNRLQIGQFVTRSNFSIQTHNLFYVDDRNKGHNRPVQIQIPEHKLDFTNQVHYRSERQVLTRLPETEAVVFTIRTYLHPLSEIRKEGKEVCERLIGAINGLPQDIYNYKAAGEWSEAVISYLLKFEDDK